MQKILTLCCLLVALSFVPACVDAGKAESIAVVDTARILAESQPAKEGEAHLLKVRAVLQKGLTDLQAMYKGKEKTTEAQAAIQQGYQALEQQLAIERQAILQILEGALDASVKGWRAKNTKYLAVASKQMLLDSAPSIDVTTAVMQEMDKQKVTFPALPTVQLTPPKKAEPKPAPAPQKKR